MAFGVVFIMSWLMLLNYWTVVTPDGSTSSTNYGATKMCIEQDNFGSLNDMCYDFKYSSCEHIVSST